MTTETLARNPTVTFVAFAGTIRATSRDGRSGVVVLDSEVCGQKYAVISPDTDGRTELMNGVGVLKKGTHVTGLAEPGSEALRAVSVEQNSCAGSVEQKN